MKKIDKQAIPSQLIELIDDSEIIKAYIDTSHNWLLVLVKGNNNSKERWFDASTYDELSGEDIIGRLEKKEEFFQEYNLKVISTYEYRNKYVEINYSVVDPDTNEIILTNELPYYFPSENHTQNLAKQGFQEINLRKDYASWNDDEKARYLAGRIYQIKRYYDDDFNNNFFSYKLIDHLAKSFSDYMHYCLRSFRI